MNTRIKTALTGTALAVMLTGCVTITEGTVCDKRFTAEHTTPTVVTVMAGKTMITVPRTVYHPDTWEICVSGIDDGEEKTQWKTVTEEEYDSLDLGDWWEADQNE